MKIEELRHKYPNLEIRAVSSNDTHIRYLFKDQTHHRYLKIPIKTPIKVFVDKNPNPMEDYAVPTSR